MPNRSLAVVSLAEERRGAKVGVDQPNVVKRRVGRHPLLYADRQHDNDSPSIAISVHCNNLPSADFCTPPAPPDPAAAAAASRGKILHSWLFFSPRFPSKVNSTAPASDLERWTKSATDLNSGVSVLLLIRLDVEPDLVGGGSRFSQRLWDGEAMARI